MTDFDRQAMARAWGGRTPRVSDPPPESMDPVTPGSVADDLEGQIRAVADAAAEVAPEIAAMDIRIPCSPCLAAEFGF